MELHKALQVALKVVARGKNVPKILESVRIGRGQGQTPERPRPNWVAATDGNAGVVIYYEEGPAVEALIHRELISPVAKQGIRNIAQEGAKLTFETNAGVFEVQSENPALFPQVPDFPEPGAWQKFPGWDSAKKVVHAAGDSESRPEFGYVHFHEDSVQATDGYRVAISDVKCPISGMLPRKMFKAMPDGPVLVAKTLTHGFFAVGSQVRYGKLREGKCLDCQSMVPEFHDGPWITVDSTKLYDVVKCAGEVSPKNWLTFGVGIMRVTVKAWVGEEEKDYEAQVNGMAGASAGQKVTSPDLILSTKYVAEALKEIETPNVRLCYGDKDAPLRIESAGVVENVWPMR
jgi:hypothetical protein